MSCVVCPVIGRPGPAQPVVQGECCHSCFAHVLSDLIGLQRACAQLPEVVLAKRPGGRSPNKPGSRPPANLAAISMSGPASRSAQRLGEALPPLFLLRDWMLTWALQRKVDGLPQDYAVGANGKPYLRETQVDELVAFAVERLPWAAGTRNFPTFARELHQSYVAVRQLTAELTGAARPIGWCPALIGDGTRCMTELAASTWVDIIECPGCCTIYDRAKGDWDRLRMEQLVHGLAATWR